MRIVNTRGVCFVSEPRNSTQWPSSGEISSRSKNVSLDTFVNLQKVILLLRKSEAFLPADLVFVASVREAHWTSRVILLRLRTRIIVLTQ